MPSVCKYKQGNLGLIIEKDGTNDCNFTPSVVVEMQNLSVLMV
jgi:hypothetical protein